MPRPKRGHRARDPQSLRVAANRRSPFFPFSPMTPVESLTNRQRGHFRTFRHDGQSFAKVPPPRLPISFGTRVHFVRGIGAWPVLGGCWPHRTRTLPGMCVVRQPAGRACPAERSSPAARMPTGLLCFHRQSRTLQPRLRRPARPQTAGAACRGPSSVVRHARQRLTIGRGSKPADGPGPGEGQSSVRRKGFGRQALAAGHQCGHRLLSP